MPLLNHDIEPGDSYYVIVDGKAVKRTLDENTIRDTTEYGSRKEAEKAFNTKKNVFLLSDENVNGIVFIDAESLGEWIDAETDQRDEPYTPTISRKEMTLHEVYELPEYD
jgi:hypothetical protein